MKRRLVAMIALLSALSTPGAWASSTRTTSIAVTATVPTVLSVTTPPLAFGTVTVGSATPATAAIAVTSTPGSTYDVGLGLGANAVSTQRYLKGANTGILLPYDLFQDSSYQTEWGSTVGVDTLHGSGTGSQQNLNVYARIPTQGLTVDTYTDTVTVTISY
jgi:spore coat protein U domain-containing protein, fimbrial subunit CupE1/2/3/6